MAVKKPNPFAKKPNPFAKKPAGKPAPAAASAKCATCGDKMTAGKCAGCGKPGAACTC